MRAGRSNGAGVRRNSARSAGYGRLCVRTTGSSSLLRSLAGIEELRRLHSEPASDQRKEQKRERAAHESECRAPPVCGVGLRVPALPQGESARHHGGDSHARPAKEEDRNDREEGNAQDDREHGAPSSANARQGNHGSGRERCENGQGGAEQAQKERHARKPALRSDRLARQGRPAGRTRGRVRRSGVEQLGQIMACHPRKGSGRRTLQRGLLTDRKSTV
jgi:hypothetical protein